jgi:N-methylhydantoinase B
VERVVADVRKGLVSAAKARSDYGVAIDPGTLEADLPATEALRAELAEARGAVKDFDFGPPLEEIRTRARAETGLEPPAPPEPLAWAPIESGADALRRVRELGDRQMTGTE